MNYPKIVQACVQLKADSMSYLYDIFLINVNLSPCSVLVIGFFVICLVVVNLTLVIGCEVVVVFVFFPYNA